MMWWRKHAAAAAPNGYQVEETDVDNALLGSNFPSPSSVGMVGYPADFAAAMPGYTGVGANIAGIASGVPDTGVHVAGEWSTPQAYAWHYGSNLTTDPEVGGDAGDALGVPFAFGPVDTSTVEDFELRGQQAAFQVPNVMSFGDVGFNDLSGRLGAAVASYTYDQPSWEDMAASVVRGS